MPTLSDTQAILLTAAAQRADGNLLPLPGSLRGGAATKVVAALLSRGLVEEQAVETTAKADPALNTLWRNLDDGRGILLRITPAGLDALGIEADSAAVAATEAERPAATTEDSTAAEARPAGRPCGGLGQDPRGHEAGAASSRTRFGSLRTGISRAVRYEGREAWREWAQARDCRSDSH